MDYVTVAPGLPQSSRLGFGCGSIMGRAGETSSLRAIAAALDAGITHFDVARLYGYGEAEALLGRTLRGRRDRVVVASKFGLTSPRSASALRRLKPLVRSLASAFPGLRRLVRASIGAAASAPDRFSVASAGASLERSLRALSTDYLDILFLHDCGADDLGAELVAFLDEQKRAGKIRAYGVAADAATVAKMIATRSDDLIYQFGNSLCTRHADRLTHTRRPFITYSPFAGADSLRSAIELQPSLFRLPHGRRLLPADIHPLMLAYALAALNVGVVLCSMIDSEHLRRNVSVIESPPFDKGELAACVKAVGDALAPAQSR